MCEINDTMQAPAPRGGPRLATVTHRRPRCPRCDGSALRRYRSLADQGDGTALSWVRCLGANCGHRFKMILE